MSCEELEVIWNNIKAIRTLADCKLMLASFTQRYKHENIAIKFYAGEQCHHDMPAIAIRDGGRSLRHVEMIASAAVFDGAAQPGVDKYSKAPCYI